MLEVAKFPFLMNYYSLKLSAFANTRVHMDENVYTNHIWDYIRYNRMYSRLAMSFADFKLV